MYAALAQARALAEQAMARAERAEEQAFCVTMETYRTGLVGDAFRFMRYWRDRSCRQSAAARKVARYAAQATASMGAMEEQVKDARAEAARYAEALANSDPWTNDVPFNCVYCDAVWDSDIGSSENQHNAGCVWIAAAALRGPAQSEKGE